jgi:hypothetical protein
MPTFTLQRYILIDPVRWNSAVYKPALFRFAIIWLASRPFNEKSFIIAGSLDSPGTLMFTTIALLRAKVLTLKVCGYIVASGKS